jgi:hypothetical protein
MTRIAGIVLVMTSVSLGALACRDASGPVLDHSNGPHDSTVHSVTVDPGTATLKTGGQVQLLASVDAGALVVDHSVTGHVVIIVASKADSTVKDSAQIAVTR